MKFFSEYFNSGSIKQQNMKRLGGLLIAITALLLVLTLLALSVSSIAIAIKNRKAPNPDETGDGTGTNIPAGYTTTTFDATQLANGNLLLIDATHPYTGSQNMVQPDTNSREKDENNNNLYRGDYAEIHLTQETLDAFNAMMAAFHKAKKDTAGYEVGRLYLDSSISPKSAAPSENTKAVLASGTCLILAEQALDSTENEVTIYDSESTQSTSKGVYAWIYDNAHHFGFVRVSSAEGEENIFRYVGIAHATYMKSNNKTLAEYLTLLKEKKNTPSSALNFSAKDSNGNTVNYRVYYQVANAETVPVVPTKYAYTVSGDNMGGYIITVNTSVKASTN